ncbi:MAG: hypothetical protein J6X18_12225 [Bacteroidales bacterium]|nr:hypothetical protein [Bacteroidales bacterium]
MRKFPKQDITELKLKRGHTGNHQRFLLQMESFDNNFYLPNPVEYEDIDDAFIEFVDEKIELVANGKKVPTYTLFSNHRFSEFSQTYGHTDEEGNLLMDFKTVGRETNPKAGSGQDGLYNIPGNRRYTVGIRSVLDDNGTEHYEVSSMEQPVALDFIYTVSYITADFSKLNDFNIILNTLFQSKQYYISPNGYKMPLYLDDVSDQSEYSIDNRKVFIQTATITLKGYVIPKSTLRIEKFPKRHRIGIISGFNPPKPVVEVEGDDKTDCIVLSFPKRSNSVSFEYDGDFRITGVETDNVRSYRVSVNGEYVPDIVNFALEEGDDVFVQVIPVDFNFPSKLSLCGLEGVWTRGIAASSPDSCPEWKYFPVQKG